MEWQQQNSRGDWVRLPNSASKKLEAALQRGETSCRVRFRGTMREMDLVRMTQTSSRAGKTKVCACTLGWRVGAWFRCVWIVWTLDDDGDDASVPQCLSSGALDAICLVALDRPPNRCALSNVC